MPKSKASAENLSGHTDLSGMSFEVSSKQKQFLQKVDSACKSIRPLEDEFYLNEQSNLENIISKFGGIGMLGCPVSRKYGGLGYDMLTYALALERIGQEGSSLRTFFSVHTSLGQLVLEGWGNEDQKKQFLPGTSSGKSIMAFALTEPAAGSDPSSMITKFEAKDGGYILRGKKHWIGNGTFADVITTYAKDSAGKVSAFIVDRKLTRSGLNTREMKYKMGLLTVKNAEIYFDSCFIPKKNLLGVIGQGLNIAYSALIDGRLSVAAGAVGVMQDCLEESISYSKSRQQHGSVLAKKQLIQEHIARIAISLESSKWLVYRAAAARQKLRAYIESLKGDHAKLNRGNEEYSDLRKEADKLTSIAKFHSTNCAFDASNRSVQIFGSLGYLKTARVARHFLDSRATTIYEGANEVLILKIASIFLGNKYRSY